MPHVFLYSRPCPHWLVFVWTLESVSEKCKLWVIWKSYWQKSRYGSNQWIFSQILRNQTKRQRYCIGKHEDYIVEKTTLPKVFSSKLSSLCRKTFISMMKERPKLTKPCEQKKSYWILTNGVKSMRHMVYKSRVKA